MSEKRAKQERQAARKAEADLLDKQASHVENKIKSTGTIGSSKKPQLIKKDQELLVTYDELRSKGATGDGRPIIPVATEANPRGGWDHILKDADFYAVQRGEVCAKCLQWQKVGIMSPVCLWREPKFSGRMIGCGHQKEMSIDLNYI
jgi:hypothetical protein